METKNKSISTRQAYKIMLMGYPDVLDVCHICEILKISRKTVYNLMSRNMISHIRIGRKYKVAKIDFIRYLMGN